MHPAACAHEPSERLCHADVRRRQGAMPPRGCYEWALWMQVRAAHRVQRLVQLGQLVLELLALRNQRLALLRLKLALQAIGL